MAKRKAEAEDFDWNDDDAAEDGEKAGPLSDDAEVAPVIARAGFHLQAARRIEEARESRQLRKALEDFDDYDV